MPIFEYKGLNKTGKNVKGIIDSENIRVARARLKKEHIYVVEIKDKKKGETKKSSIHTSGKSVGVKDLSLMTRQLATLIKANIPLVDALNAISEQVENPTLSEAVADCKNMVNEGSPLHKALAKYPNIFTKIYLSMVEAGEMSGSLDVILIRLAEFTEAQSDLRQKVTSAMTYPVIVLFVVVGILVGLFVFMIPKMMGIFEAYPNLELPWYTKIIFDMSGVIVNYWYIIFGLTGILVAGFFSWKKTPEGSDRWDAIILTLPLVGPMARMIAVSRFTRTLSTLLNGGVPMLNALDIVRNVVDNHVIALAVDEAKSNISEGESIAGPLKRSGQFPPIVIHMVNIGEKTGDLENMLTQVSDAFDFQVKNKLEGLTGLMTPVVTVLMGIIVFVIVISIMVPMMQLTDMGN